LSFNRFNVVFLFFRLLVKLAGVKLDTEIQIKVIVVIIILPPQPFDYIIQNLQVRLLFLEWQWVDCLGLFLLFLDFAKALPALEC
jgi:hypothetical protein